MGHMVHNWINIDFEIILSLLIKENHLRAISRSIKIPHATLSRKIKELININIIDSKIDGKNKIFFLKNNLLAKSYIFNAEKYKLIKLLKTYPELNIILEDFLKKFKEKIIIVFGSYAKFSAKKESDIDIYIETNNDKIIEQAKLISSKINIKTGKFNKDSLLVKEIIKNHVILKGVEEYYEKAGTFK